MKLSDFTEIHASGGPDEDQVFTVYLNVGQQHFAITPGQLETIQEAEWYQKMLVTALGALVDQYSADQRIEDLKKQVADRDGWIAQYRQNQDQIGKMLEPLREKRETGEPARSDVEEIRAVISRLVQLETKFESLADHLAPDELFDLFSQMKDKAERADRVAGREYSGKSWLLQHFEPAYGRGEFQSFDQTGAIFEFNASCGCHPSNETYEIPYEWLTMNEDKLRTVLRDRIAIADRIEAERKAANDALKDQQIEANERMQLAKLKAKYESEEKQ